MSRFDEKDFRLGDYWLSQQARSPAWCRTWYDPVKRQTKRASLGTTEFEEAKALLTEWFVLNHRKEKEEPESADLATALLRYWEDHAKSVKSAPSIRGHLRYWTEHFGEASIAEATSFDAIEGFKRALARKDLKPQTINHVLKSGRAALRMAWKRGELLALPPIEMLPQSEQEPMGRPLSLDECHRLLNESDRPSSQHLHRFILLSLATAARPAAVVELTWGQLDFEHRLIQLNPPGRPQNKKHRPIVKMPDLIAERLESEAGKPGDAPVISYRGAPIQKVSNAWRKLRTRAGVDGAANTYSFRHTIARHLRAQGVPAWEVAAQLGHKTAGTTDRYAPFSPEYLSNAVREIDGFLRSACELRVSGDPD